MFTLRAVATFLLVAAGAVAQTAETPTAAKPEFEVVSVKPSAPGSHGMFIRTAPGGRVNMTNMTLKEMIIIAYRVQPHQVSGGPPWLDSLHYDISAKAESTPKQGDIQLMLQAMLADRFQLTIHRETKELPIYALMLARKDGKLGPSLTETKEGSCVPFDPTKPPAPPQPGSRPCGMMRMQQRELDGTSIPVSNLIPMFSRTLGRTVVDKTGLTGNYDIHMQWTPDETQLALLPPDAPKPAPSDETGPSFFTAIQEQLGLKLESQKGPVEVIVIDRAEKLSEN